MNRSRWAGLLIAGAVLLAGCAADATSADTTASTSAVAPTTAMTTAAKPATSPPSTAPTPTSPPATVAATTTPTTTTVPTATTAPTTTAPPSEEQAVSERVLQYYDQLYSCYEPSGCDFKDVEAFFTPGSDAVDNVRRPLERFRADRLSITNLDEIKFKVLDVDLQTVDGETLSGTVVVCQFDPARVVDANGNLLDDDVLIKRHTLIVVKVDGQWTIFESNPETLAKDDDSCGF